MDQDSDPDDPCYQPPSKSSNSEDESQDSIYNELPDGRLFSKKSLESAFRNFKTGQLVPWIQVDEPAQRRRDLTRGMIAYRVTDDKSQGNCTTEGIWAGDFAEGYTTPPSINDPSYYQAVVRHLRREKDIASPLISIWNSPISAIHKLVTSHSATATFIDLDYLRRDPSEYPIVQKAAVLIWQYCIKELGFPNGDAYGYRGDVELLVWRHIEKHAIISTLFRTEFDLFVLQNPDLERIFALPYLRNRPRVDNFEKSPFKKVANNFRVGFNIGKFLKRVEIPRRFVEKTAEDFARCFHFQLLVGATGRSDKQNKQNKEYMEGVWTGFEYLPAQAGVPSMPISVRKQSLFDQYGRKSHRQKRGHTRDTGKGKRRLQIRTQRKNTDDDDIPLLELLSTANRRKVTKLAERSSGNHSTQKRQSILFKGSIQPNQQRFSAKPTNADIIRRFAFGAEQPTNSIRSPSRSSCLPLTTANLLAMEQVPEDHTMVALDTSADKLSLASAEASHHSAVCFISDSSPARSYGHSPIGVSPDKNENLLSEDDNSDSKTLEGTCGDSISCLELDDERFMSDIPPDEHLQVSFVGSMSAEEGFTSDIVPDEHMDWSHVRISTPQPPDRSHIGTIADAPPVDEFMERRRRIDACLSSDPIQLAGHWEPMC